MNTGADFFSPQTVDTCGPGDHTGLINSSTDVQLDAVASSAHCSCLPKFIRRVITKKLEVIWITLLFNFFKNCYFTKKDLFKNKITWL